MIDPDQLVWENMLAHLRAQHPKLCRQWFETIEPVGITDGSLFVRAHSATHARYLRDEECIAAFNDAICTATNRLMGVRFLGPGDPSPRRDGAESPADAGGRRAGNGGSANGVGQIPGSQGLDTQGVGHARGPESRERPSHAPPSVDQFSAPGRDAGERGTARATPDRGRDGESGAASVTPVNPRPAGLGSTEARPPSTGGTVMLSADFDFDSFVVGPGNRLAYAAAHAVSENPGRAYNPLFIHGGVGLGKTHLLQAICGKVLDENPRAMVHFDSCESFMNDFIESVESGKMKGFRHRFRDVDLLVIDDIHFLAKREHCQEEFFHTFNSLYAQKKQIVLSSDAMPESIPDLEKRLVSRFKWGLVTEVEPPGFDTRVAILRKKARLRGFEMPHAVAEYIAGRVKQNIRELEGAVSTLQMVAQVSDRPIDLAMVREAMGDTGERGPMRAPTIDEIISEVCKRFDVKRTDILGKKRTRSITLPRHVAVYLARKLTRNSLQEIGGSFGGRDHTTVMHACESMEERRRQDAELEAIIRQLEKQLQPERAFTDESGVGDGDG